MVALRDAMGKMVGDAVYCVGSVMEVSDLLQERRTRFGRRMEKTWHMVRSSA